MISHPLPAYPRKLLLLSSDSKEEAILRAHLDKAEDGEYELYCVKTLEALWGFFLDDICHAILLDMRIPPARARKAIHAIGSIQGSVALLCLCQNHDQLLEFKDIIHLVDDYLLAETLIEGELPTRISHTIHRRQKESKLLIEQQQLQELIDNIPDSIYFKNLDSRFTHVNPAMERNYWQKNAEGLIGKRDADLFLGTHAESALEDEKKIINTGEPLVGKIEKEILPDGTVKWVTTTKLPLHGNNGKVIGTMGISRDITEQKLIEDELAQERNWLQTILDNVPDRIFVKDGEGRYIASNKNHLQFLGLKSEAEVIGTTLLDHFPKEVAAEYHEIDRKIIENSMGLLNIEENRRNPDGSVSWFLTSKVPLITSEGETVGLVGIARDITTQKKHEEQLRNTIKILNDTQLQLIEAEKLKTVGRLAAGIAHEIKNPLSVVTLGMDILKEQLEASEDLVTIIEDMQQAIEKASSVIFELLDYSSPHEISMLPMDINAVIHRVLGLMRHNLNSSHIKLHDELGSELPQVLVDAPKMEQVFINLFLNAISMMKDGGDLSVRTYEQKVVTAGDNVSGNITECFCVGDRIVVIEIKDTGPGIAAEDQEKAFEPFYSTKPTGEGTGLGLSVTRSIIDMHRGLITLENRADDTTGACVTLRLPTD